MQFLRSLPLFPIKLYSDINSWLSASLAIAFVGYFVWGHHMFTSGMSGTALYTFSLLTFLVAIPSAIKVFNWIATMHKGSIDLQTPFYWAMAFIFVFMIGGFSGLILGSLATNVHLHNTHFVVAHFHFIVFGGTGFAFFGAMHYWYPKITGKMYDKIWANIGLVLFFIGFITLYGPMFYLGYLGMPRRYFDYDEVFHSGNISFINGCDGTLCRSGYNYHQFFHITEKRCKSPFRSMGWKDPRMDNPFSSSP